jgi:hypothetical protein
LYFMLDSLVSMQVGIQSTYNYKQTITNQMTNQKNKSKLPPLDTMENTL